MIASGTLHKIQGYIDDVMNDDIVVCDLVRKAVQRHVRDMDREGDKDFPYYFDSQHAEVAVDFIESLLCHSIGEHAGLPLILEPWQAFGVSCLFGWKRADDSTRRFRKAYWSMGRKNGKSTLGAALAVLLASFDVNPGTGKPEAVANVILCATKREQVEKVMYAEIERMRMQSKHIKKMSTAINKQITFAHNQGSIRCVGSDKPYDGLNPLAILQDELHAWREHHRGFYDTMQTGSGARQQPIIITLTTAGDDQSHIWLSEYKYAKGILNQDFNDEQLFAFCFELDEKDDVLDPENWVKSNPNLGVSVKPTYLERMAKEAKQDALALNRFKRYHANQLVSSTTRAFDLELWDKCEGVLSDWRDAAAVGAGVDLGGRNDLASWSLCSKFPTGEYTGDHTPVWRYEIRTQSYIATNTRRDLTKQPFAQWVHDDLIRRCEYPVSQMERDLLDACDRYRVDQLAYDPAGAQQFAENLSQQGIRAARMGQNCGMFNGPICEFRAAMAEGRLLHDGNPLLRWCMGNAVLQQNTQQQVMLNKRDSNEKIDPVVSSVMAMWVCMVTEPRIDGPLFIS